MALNALLNSGAFRDLIALQLSRVELAQSFEVGLLQATPIPDIGQRPSEHLASLAHRGWSLRRGLDTSVEVSHAFVLPALLQVEGSDLGARVSRGLRRVRWRSRLSWAVIQGEIDERCFDLYGISTRTDRRAIIEGFGVGDAEGDW